MLISLLLFLVFANFAILAWVRSDAAAIITSFLLPSYLLRFQLFGVPFYFVEVLIYITFFILGVRFFLKREKFWCSGFEGPILFFLIAALAAVFISPDILGGLGIFKAYFLAPILFFYVLVNFVSAKQISKIISGLALSGVFLVLFGFSQYCGFLGGLREGRITSFFESANYLGLFLGPIFVLCFCLWIEDPRLRFLRCLILLILGTAIFLTFSRGTWFGVAIGTLVFGILFLLPKIKNKKFFAFVGVAFVSFFAVAFLLLPFYFRLVPESRIAASENIRIEIWKTSFQMIGQKPISGVGLGHFQEAFKEFTKDRVNYPEYISPHARTPHNIFLNFWLQTGLGGLLAFLWIAVLFYKKGFRILNSKSYILHSAIVAAMTTLIAHGLVDASYWKNDLAILFWVIIALMVIERREGARKEVL